MPSLVRQIPPAPSAHLPNLEQPFPFGEVVGDGLEETENLQAKIGPVPVVAGTTLRADPHRYAGHDDPEPAGFSGSLLTRPLDQFYSACLAAFEHELTMRFQRRPSERRGRSFLSLIKQPLALSRVVCTIENFKNGPGEWDPYMKTGARCPLRKIQSDARGSGWWVRESSQAAWTSRYSTRAFGAMSRTLAWMSRRCRRTAGSPIPGGA